MEQETFYTFLTFKQHHSWLGHFISSRHGGYSKPPFNSLNIGLHVGDKDETVIENRKQLASMVGYQAGLSVFGNQTHSCTARIINQDDAGRGSFSTQSAFDQTDAFITQAKHVCLHVMMADCVPILIADIKTKTVAAIHAGWKGTVQQIALHTIHKMQKEFGCSPQDMIAGIGPSNGPCCYEIGQDVADEVLKMPGQDTSLLLSPSGEGKYIFNQWLANKQQLIMAGLPEKNIELMEVCTQCGHNDFFSSRFHKGHTGRFAAGIWIKQ